MESTFAALHQAFVYKIQEENDPLLEDIDNSRIMVKKTKAVVTASRNRFTKAGEDVTASGAKDDENTVQLTEEITKLVAVKQETAEVANTLSSSQTEMATKEEGEHNTEHIN